MVSPSHAWVFLRASARVARPPTGADLVVPTAICLVGQLTLSAGWSPSQFAQRIGMCVQPFWALAVLGHSLQTWDSSLCGPAQDRHLGRELHLAEKWSNDQQVVHCLTGLVSWYRLIVVYLPNMKAPPTPSRKSTSSCEETVSTIEECAFCRSDSGWAIHRGGSMSWMLAMKGFWVKSSSSSSDAERPWKSFRSCMSSISDLPVSTP